MKKSGFWRPRFAGLFSVRFFCHSSVKNPPKKTDFWSSRWHARESGKGKGWDNPRSQEHPSRNREGSGCEFKHYAHPAGPRIHWRRLHFSHYLSIHLSIYLSIYLSVSLSVCLSVYPSRVHRSPQSEFSIFYIFLASFCYFS